MATQAKPQVKEVDQALLNGIDRLAISGRLAKLRQLFLDSKICIAAERATLAMKSCQETEGEPIEQRYARKLQRILEGIPVVIHPGELLVGSPTRWFRGANPPCDFDGSFLDGLMAEGKITVNGPVQEGVITPEDWQALTELSRFYKTQTTAADYVKQVRRSLMGTWFDDLVDAGGVHRTEGFSQFAGVADNEKLVALGLQGIINEAEERVRRFADERSEDLEALDFWRAVIIAAKAAIAFAHRYSRHARDLAAQEGDPARQAELLEIAEICAWVPEHPARTFQEALQSIVMLDLVVRMESTSVAPGGWGNIDYYLYPYFKRDLDAGRLSLEKAADLIGCALTYLVRREKIPEATWRLHSQTGILVSLSLGGPTTDGAGDMSTELSSLVLHVAGLMGYPDPHVTLRWHEGTPRWLMRKAIDTNLKVHGGVPQFQNSEHIVKFLVNRGISPESARGWVSAGCSQAEPADQRNSMVAPYLNIALPVDLALHNGVASATGKQLGPETGDPSAFSTFDELYNAFKIQCEHMMRKCLWQTCLSETAKGTLWRQPLGSALLPGCMEKGRDYIRGGLPHYRNWNVKDRGIIPAADSLMAVKKLVFDERKLTMKELAHALDTNFEGERGEAIRRMCLAAPKYGNDIDEVDSLVRDVGKFSAGVIMSTKNMFGYPYTPNRNGQAWHSANGKKMGALPNGRKAREPLYDGSLSPMQGMDTRGPTAVLKSALKADFTDSIASILNLKFPASFFRSPETRDKIIDLTETFFRQGGSYIQYNLIDRQMLLEARRNPQAYRDLVIRVGGYSAYFVTLSPEVQEEIIRRTEQAW